MKFPKELTTVSPLSKILAAILFIALPFAGFFLGIRYQEMADLANKQKTTTSTMCAEDAKICPDGTHVGRQTPSCKFSPCPTINPDQVSVKGKVCGGPVLEPCPSGYFCKISTTKSGDLTETSGECIKEDQIVCTQDAKLCSDGKTYVSRQPPNCEFASCPN